MAPLEGIRHINVYYDLLLQTSVLCYTMLVHMEWSAERWHEQEKNL